MIVDFFECPYLNWMPVIEHDYGQERYLTAEPNDLWRAGNFSKVNVMTGVTADEFIQPVAGKNNLIVNVQEIKVGLIFSYFGR